MPLPLAFLTKQYTDTAGTGTLTRGTSSAEFRPIATATGSVSTAVGYRASLEGSAQWEIGVGVHNGANPGTLTRPTILANHLGTTAAVSFSAGRKDVQLVSFPGQRQTLGFTTTATAALVDLGSILDFTGSAATTLTLPAAATVPVGVGYMIRNSGSSGAWLTVDGNASELVGVATAQILLSGETMEIFSTGTGWSHTALPSQALVRTIAGTAVGNIDFALPSTVMLYRLEFALTLGSAAALLLRTSVDGGATFASSAGNYDRAWSATAGASSANTGADAGTAMLLTITGAANTPVYGSADLFPGDGAFGAQLYNVGSKWTDSGGALAGIGTLGGNRAVLGAVNAVRVLPSSGNFVAGGFVSLYARRI